MSHCRKPLSSPLPLLIGTSYFLLLTGCASQQASIEPRPGPLRSVDPATADASASRVEQNPRAYLQEVLENKRRLDQYTLVLTRQERRGLFRNLKGPERIKCWFRREPFSVRMKWLDEDVKYGESTYVEGRQNNQVRFVPRHGFLGLAPSVTRVDVQTPVTFGEARYPVTDFGLERLMERTTSAMAEAGDDVLVTYEGLTNVPGSERTVHHIRLKYLPSANRAPIQDLYVDVESDLPAATIIKLDDDRIDTAFVYDAVDPSVSLTDEDFLLEAERDTQIAEHRSADRAAQSAADETPGAAAPQ